MPRTTEPERMLWHISLKLVIQAIKKIETRPDTEFLFNFVIADMELEVPFTNSYDERLVV